MMNNIVMKVARDALRKDLPEINPGNKVRLSIRVKEKEGEKERFQVFEGRVIARAGSGISETFTVRKIAPGGIGVERIFPLHSPVISNIKVLEKKKVRRAKLYYLERSVKDLKKL